MSKGKAFSCSTPELVLCFLLITTLAILHQTCAATNQQTCAPSSCGKITIRDPFRLKDDAAICGDPRYELACENNTTVLYLFSGNYYVQAINYNNFTIRLVDPGISEADCSSIPRYFLSSANFSDTYDESGNYYPYEAIQRGRWQTVFTHVIYLNCSNEVRDDPQYVDTSPCINWHSKGHIYAIAGELQVVDFKDDCRVKLVAASSSPSVWSQWMEPSLSDNHSFPYAEIHRILSYGFYVSWMTAPCELRCGHDNCIFDGANSDNLSCVMLNCHTPLGHYHCGKMSMMRIIAEDYVYGILKGFRQIVRTDTGDDYQTVVSLRAIKVGVVTGKFVVPYIIVKITLGFIFFFALLIYTCRRRHISMYENIEDFLQGNTLMPIRYSYKEIKKMTRGFKDKLGEGGFGSVYKGKLRSGPFVAVKMLGKAKANGQEFISEVATIGRIHHANVVRLIGFCVEGSKRALVYEFMPNGSLDRYIFSKEDGVSLTYEKLFEISLGVARGIAYLHQGCDMQILHFDIKPHNILLDENFIPRVSDFGLAKLSPIDKSIVTLTTARGTIGYIAPELFYKNIGAVSYKADVYSFGMLLMEMASRRRNMNPRVEHSSQAYFPFWIYDQLIEESKKESDDVIHEKRNELAKKMFIIALWCIQLKPNDRPPMNKVVEMLEGDVESIEMPPKPSFYPNEDLEIDSRLVASYDSFGTSSFDEEMTTNPLLKFSS